MLSENFKNRIDKTTDLKELQYEVEIMRRIMYETKSTDTKKEMKERIDYARERIRAIKRG
jgi:hypothetical protein